MGKITKLNVAYQRRYAELKPEADILMEAYRGASNLFLDDAETAESRKACVEAIELSCESKSMAYTVFCLCALIEDILAERLPRKE